MAQFLKELAVENFTHIPALLAAGADRIELNDNLAVGGTTVSRGVMAEATRYIHEKQRSVAVMIRPRGGDFVYNDTEIKIMEADVFSAQELGADAIVTGALTPAGDIDTDAMEQLIAAAAGMDVVFHMAFDAIPEEKQATALTWLAAHDVVRVLTHGGPLTTPINNTLPHLAETIKAAPAGLTILPGGGVTAVNADQIAETLHVKQLHGTKLITI
ncbi:copper homeostasis protein CutC [Schleiferilactobacillus harbinensis]|uniref:copper homeostasis protein CutC n=1 Tax=Schleiferilactobacillus harbinensis TaxID=304207 RepID=UPI001FBBEC28|nr:copper homeostasis protein CutC [Schleiferilactobacillus harbinensis]